MSPLFRSVLVFMPVLMVLAACAPMKATRGNLIDDTRLNTLTVGTSTRADVMRVLGSPTTQDPFDDQTWYYIGQKTEKKGILDPKVTAERVVRVRFDPATGVLAELSPLNTHRNEVPLVTHTTPTSGNDLTAIQQMMSNMGKFNKAAGDARNER